MTLDQLHCGEAGTIVDIGAGHGLNRRLQQMGLHVGDVVTVSSQAILKGPLLVTVHGMQIALGRGVARRIVVDPRGRSRSPLTGGRR